MKDEIEVLKQRLKEAATKVPYEVQNGSIQLTRSWMENQAKAMKVLSKKRPSEVELLSAINSLSVLT